MNASFEYLTRGACQSFTGDRARRQAEPACFSCGHRSSPVFLDLCQRAQPAAENVKRRESLEDGTLARSGQPARPADMRPDEVPKGTRQPFSDWRFR